jgi:hypothetical protein
MKLFKIEQEENDDWDTFDSAVVCCQSAEIAQHMNPSDGKPMTVERWKMRRSDWCSNPEQVKVTYLGEADDSIPVGVVVASFNAG